MSFGWLTVFFCKDVFGENMEKKDSVLLESCGTLTPLEGISNWINNCLIPISQLDPSARTEEAVSYGKERKKTSGREIGEEERSTRDIVLEIDEHDGKPYDRWTGQTRRHMEPAAYTVSPFSE